ncbi:MAG: TonB-dependent receptor plug domain-containing protein [Bacteroidales bacterium]|nr:TonB-dependent receptor plug domain-containing protein [Bacteroidales bacterium]
MSTGLLCLFFASVFAQTETTDSIKSLEVEEVIINASRQGLSLDDIPQKVEIISKTAIAAVPNENLAEALKRVANIDIIQYPGVSASVGMRGFSPSAHSRSYTLILLNGKPMGTCNIAAIDPEMIESIEVVKGPYSMLYGTDAMGGIINIITKKDFSQTSGSASISVGSNGKFNTSARVFGKLTDKSKLILGFSHRQQMKDYRIGGNNLLEMNKKQLAILDEASFNDVMKNSTFSTNQINGSYIQSIAKSWTVSAEAIYFIANDIETPGNYWGSAGQSKKDIERFNFYLPITQKSERNSFEISPYFTLENTANYSDNSDTGYVSLDTKVSEYGLKLNDSYSFGKLKCMLGGDWDMYDYNSDRYSSKTLNINPYKPDNRNSKLGVLLNLHILESI